MKLTESKLRSIIREEFSRLSEAQDSVPKIILNAAANLSKDFIKNDLGYSNVSTDMRRRENMFFLRFGEDILRVDVKHVGEGRLASTGRSGGAEGKFAAEFSNELMDKKTVQFDSAESLLRGKDQHDFIYALETVINSMRY